MKRLLTVFLTASLLLSCAACGGQSSKPQETTAATQAATEAAGSPVMQALLDKVVRQTDFSGVAILTQNGKLLAQAATGTANAETGAVITPDTQFCVASVSKQFAAAAILLLQEQGRLSTADTLDAFFPAYAYGDVLTVRHLLTMRSGVPDHIAVDTDNGREALSPDEWDFSVDESKSRTENQAAVLEWILEQPLHFEPDTQYEYSNSNYFLLAQMVEQAAGMPYEDFIRQNIFEPLGMTHSGFIHELWDSPDAAQPNPADDPLYTLGNAGGVTQGAGDIVTTAQDMDVWLTSLREETLLSADSYAEMTENYGNNYGYGLMVNYLGGVGHTGQIASYASLAYTNPDKGLNFFAVTNDSEAMTGNLSEIVTRLMELVGNH